jgi:uncharacterized protein YbjT (DUF2867 family)
MTTYAVTGAFSYTGKYIAERLLARGVGVRGLVRTIPKDLGPIDVRPLQFQDREQLTRDLAGVDVLFNTYWIRFEHDGVTFRDAINNSARLFDAAVQAGVGRIVHISVTNPDRASPFPYFSGKAEVEEALATLDVPYSVVRPTIVFGKEDVLINNMAWILRTFHAFLMPGRGRYRVQPVFVGDVADLAVAEATESGARVIDAAGPEVFAFKELLELLARTVRARAVLIPAPTAFSLVAGLTLSRLVNDVMITRDELGALTAETLITAGQPAGQTRLTDWLAATGPDLGRRYTSERGRHWQRP